MNITPVSAPPSTNNQGMDHSSYGDRPSFKMHTNYNSTVYPPPDAQVAPQEDKDKEAAVEATQPLSPQLALLAKERRALQRRTKELELREKEVQSKNSAEFIELSRLKNEPLRVLLENGVTYDQLTQAIMSGQGGNQETYDLQQKIKSLEANMDQKFTDQTTQQEKHVLLEMERDARSLVNSSDDFELVRINNSVPKAVKLVERLYKERGELIDITEALKLVEDEHLKDAEKIALSKKLQSRFSPVAQQMQSTQRQTGMRTLTNRDTAAVSMSAKQRAVAAFYGNLKR